MSDNIDDWPLLASSHIVGHTSRAAGGGGARTPASLLRSRFPAPPTGYPLADPAPTTNFAKARCVATQAYVTIASPGTGYVVGEVLDLTGGTFIAPVQLVVASIGAGGSITGITLRVVGAYSVDPVNPVAVGSTTGAGSGATFNLTLSASDPSTLPNATVYNLFAYPGAYRADWVLPITNIGGSGMAGGSTRLGEEQEIEFWADGDVMEAHFLDYNSRINILVDGKIVDKLTTPNTGSPAILYRLDLGAPGVHHYRISGINMAIRSIKVPAGCQIWAPTERRRPLVYVIGDSYTGGTGTTGGHYRSWAHVMGNVLNLDVVGLGIGSTGWLTTGGNTAAARVVSAFSRGHVPDYVMFALGYNDAGGNMLALATAAEEAIDAVRAGSADTRPIIIGPWTPQGETANLVAVKETLMGVCADQKVAYADISTANTAANMSRYIGGDLVHPNGDESHEYLGARVAQSVSPYL